MALPMGLLKKFESGYQEIKKHSENVKFREWKSDRFVEIKGGHHFEFFEARKALVSLFTGVQIPFFFGIIHVFFSPVPHC